MDKTKVQAYMTEFGERVNELLIGYAQHSEATGPDAAKESFHLMHDMVIANTPMRLDIDTEEDVKMGIQICALQLVAILILTGSLDQ